MCSSDLVLVDALLGRGLTATALRPVTEKDLGDQSEVLFPHLRERNVQFFDSPGKLLRLLRRFDVVFSFTASIGFALDRAMFAYPALQRLGWPPYINVSTGADISERARDSSRIGMLQRFTMRRAFAQSIPPYPEAVRTAAIMRLRNACVLPPVQLRLANEEDLRPTRERWRFRRSEQEFLLVHASNLDWGEADSGPRASTKGNDRFLRALAEFAPDSNRPVRLIVLDRGSDRGNARRLVGELGLGEYVDWHSALSREDLFDAMREADLVVDQFDIGALGMIAWEAFNLGRPVLTYVESTSERLTYDETSPVLNAHTVHEIVERLREASNADDLEQRTHRATEWARARSTDALLPRYLFYATLATGRPAADFGWDRPHGHQWAADAQR